MTRQGALFLAWIDQNGRTEGLARYLGIEAVFISADSRSLLIRYSRQWQATARLLKRRRPSVVVVMQPPIIALLSVLLYARWSGAAVAGDLHTGVFSDPKWAWSARLLVRLLLPDGLAIVTNDELAARTRRQGVKTLVLHDLIELRTELSDATALPFGLRADEFVLVPLAYAHDEPLHAILGAARGMPEVTWVLTGRAPEHVRAGAPGNVRFTGFVSADDFGRLLGAAGVVLAATTEEHTMQRAAYEALSAGRALVTTDTAVLRSYYGDAASRARPEAAEIRRAVSHVLADRARWRRLITDLRERKIGEQDTSMRVLGAWVDGWLQRTTGRETEPNRPWDRRVVDRILPVLLIAALVAGALQNVVSAFAASEPVLLADDALVVLATALALTRLGRVRVTSVVFVGLWAAVVVLGFVQAAVELELALLIARQLALPAMLIFIGLVLTRSEWLALRLAVIWIALVNAAYMAAEVAGLRLIDPLDSPAAEGIWISNGLPGYYLYFFGEGDFLVRAGGLFLNPPIAGIVTATAFVFLWRTPEFRLNTVLLVVLGAATAVTMSRAGALILVVGIGLPLLIRLLGRMAGAVVAVAAVSVGGIVLFSQAGSGAHALGLYQGFIDGVLNPLGRGFGYAGNYANAAGSAESSESLIGIAFSGGGWLAIGLILALLAVIVRSTFFRRLLVWHPLALAAILSAMLSETAAALNGTVGLWIAVGWAFGSIRAGAPGPELTASHLEATRSA